MPPERQLSENKYLSIDEISQIDPKILTKEQEKFGVQIMACKYKKQQLLRKYNKHNLYKITTGEIKAPKKDVVTTCWLFRNLKAIITELEEKEQLAQGKPSSANMDDFLAMARAEVVEIIPPDSLQTFQSTSINMMDDELDGQIDDEFEEIDQEPPARIAERLAREIQPAHAGLALDSPPARIAERLAREIQSWLDAMPFPRLPDITFLIEQIGRVSPLTLDDPESGADVREVFRQQFADLYHQLIAKIRTCFRLTPQEKNASEAGLELLLWDTDEDA